VKLQEAFVAALAGARRQSARSASRGRLRFAGDEEINLGFARNTTSYFNTLQQGLMPQ
jgi:hypothetical protein